MVIITMSFITDQQRLARENLRNSQGDFAFTETMLDTLIATTIQKTVKEIEERMPNKMGKCNEHGEPDMITQYVDGYNSAITAVLDITKSIASEDNQKEEAIYAKTNEGDTCLINQK